jgi:hypothetical protein
LSNDYLEEYKTLREEILYRGRRKINIVIYTVLATGALLGYAIQNPSPYVFLIPLAILIPFSYNIKGLANGNLKIATYISVVIESKSDRLNWETFNKKYRKNTSIFGRPKPRQLQHMLVFDLLTAICIIGSYSYRTMADITQLSIIWIVVVIYFIWWNSSMWDCFSFKRQKEYETQIRTTLNLEET